MQREDEMKSYIKNCNDSLGAMIEGMKVNESKSNRIDEYDNSNNIDICIDPLVSNKQKVICYDDIIGNDFAKQALKENIMYQFLLPKEVKNKLFTGIRRGAGNVLLYGIYI
jgi:SpoVK/Ycf46/Vps4 family AAA+-type ATPase